MSEAPRAKGDAVERWRAPSVDGPIVGRNGERNRDADQVSARAAHTRGYEAGLAAARAEVQRQQAELQTRITRLDSILRLLSRPLEELDAEVEQQLTLLALTTAKQIVRRELKTDPAQVIAVIRESVGRLPAASRDVRVHLHPEDAAVVRELLATPTHERAWSIVEDPALTRGGCVVRTETSQIDARLESRLNAVLSAALGDERAPARSGSAPQQAGTE